MIRSLYTAATGMIAQQTQNPDHLKQHLKRKYDWL